MAEKIKLYELDLDTAKMEGKLAELSKSMNDLKQENKLSQKELEQLSESGRESSESFKSLSIKIEQNKDQIKTSRREYTQISKTLNAYNTSKLESLQINDKLDGSINELQKALIANKALYRNLSHEERENEAIGGKLLKTIEAQDAKYKDLQRSIGTTQVDVGDYRGAIKDALKGNLQFNAGIVEITKKIPLFGGVLSSTIGSLLSFKTALKGTESATGSTARSLKILKLALVSTGIGAIIALLGSLVSAFLSVEKSMDKVKVALSPIVGGFKSLIGVIQNISINMFGQMGDRFAIASNTIVNGINAIRLKWNQWTNDAKDIAEIQQDIAQRSQQIEKAQLSLNQKTMAFTNILKGSVKEINKGVHAQKELERLSVKIEQIENRNILQRAKSLAFIKAQNKIGEDTRISEQQRIKALQMAVGEQDKLDKAEQQLIKLKIKRKQLENSFNDTSREDEKRLQELKAESFSQQEESMERLTTIQNKINVLTQGAIKRNLDQTLKAIEEEFSAKIKAFENNKTLTENQSHSELETLSKLHSQRLALVNQMKEANIITAQEEMNRKLEIQASYDQTLLDLDQAKRDVLNERVEFEKEQQSLLREQYIENETQRLEFDLEQLELKHQAELEKAETLGASKNEIEERFALERLNLIAKNNRLEFKEKQRFLKKQKDQDLKNELLTESQRLGIQNAYAKAHINLNQQKAKAEHIIERQKTLANLQLASQLFANIAELAGEGTAIAKAAGVAQTIINTSTAVMKAMAEGGPFLGPALSATIIALGAKNIHKILTADSGVNQAISNIALDRPTIAQGNEVTPVSVVGASETPTTTPSILTPGDTAAQILQVNASNSGISSERLYETIYNATKDGMSAVKIVLPVEDVTEIQQQIVTVEARAELS